MASLTNKKPYSPVIFDVLSPNSDESILPEDYKMVLHVPPQSMSIKYQKVISRIQTKGGFVEQHYGEGEVSMDFELVTGAFTRLYTGVISNTSPSVTGATRRDTLAYDSYLDMLALFHNNGSVYDTNGNIVLQGKIKIVFDGGVYLGWFSSFSVDESKDSPYSFTMSASFICDEEIQNWRTIRG